MNRISIKIQETQTDKFVEVEKQPFPFADEHVDPASPEASQLRLRRRRQAQRTAAAVVSSRLAHIRS